MDWEKVDLTMEGVIGGNEHPNMPWHMRQRESDLYLNIFREDRNGMFQIVDDHQLGMQSVLSRKGEWTNEDDVAVNDYHNFFDSWPSWAVDHLGAITFGYASMGGDKCDSCGARKTILDRSFGICDPCDEEMNERLRANPNLVFAFG